MQQLIAYRGIVGGPRWRVQSFEHRLTPGWRLLLHTDGIRSRLPNELLERADLHGLDSTRSPRRCWTSGRASPTTPRW